MLLIFSLFLLSFCYSLFIDICFIVVNIAVALVVFRLVIPLYLNVNVIVVKGEGSVTLHSIIFTLSLAIFHFTLYNHAFVFICFKTHTLYKRYY